MKAYVINAQIHQPSPSNFVYVELINQLDSIQSRIKIKKDSIGFQGYLKLNKELPTGESLVDFFQKLIPVDIFPESMVIQWDDWV